MTDLLRKFRDFLLEVVFPGQAAKALSDFIAAHPELENAPARDGTYSLLPYRHPAVRSAVWLFKYRGSREIGRIFGTAIAAHISAKLPDHPLFARVDTQSPQKPLLVIPIPSSKKRLRERGFDHGAMLAGFSAEKDAAGRFEIGHGVLYKIKDTKRQAHVKDRKIRLQNQKDSMAADPKKASGRLIILIDDVSTTGATFAEAKRALQDAGARAILCFSLCR